MFGSRLILTGVVLLTLLAVALGAARPSSGAAPETRYVIQPGDTLWGIAEAAYGGDPRKGVWDIRRRNGLETALLVPGEVLVLP
jgi:nucleoid-associated protein YgaU